jgi:hypothetical protein
MLRKLWLSLLLVTVSLASAQNTRHFTFRYDFTVKNVPAGERVRVWFPAAQSDEFQELKVISANGDLKLKKTHESRFGNEMYYAESAKAQAAELHFEVIYDVVRHERLTLGIARPHLAEVELKERDRKQYLQPDKLVPVTGLPAELAAKVTEGETTPLDKARAIYDYVFMSSMRARPKKATAPIFIRCSSPWLVRRVFPRASRLDFLCRRTSIPRRLPAITAGPISSNRNMAGFR